MNRKVLTKIFALLLLLTLAVVFLRHNQTVQAGGDSEDFVAGEVVVKLSAISELPGVAADFGLASEGGRVGLQLGVRDANIFQIAAVSISPDERKTVFADGGYYSDASAPPGYSKGQSYRVSLTINGTSREVKTDGRGTASHQALLVFNQAGEGGMPAYTISFDLPPNLNDIAQLRVEKVATTAARWSIGDIKLIRISTP